MVENEPEQQEENIENVENVEPVPESQDLGSKILSDEELQKMEDQDKEYVESEMTKAKEELETAFEGEVKEVSKEKDEISKEILEALEKAMGEEAHLTLLQGEELRTATVIPEYIDDQDLCITTEDGIGMFIKISEIKKVEIQSQIEIREMSPEDFAEMIDQIPALKEMLQERKDELKNLSEKKKKTKKDKVKIEELSAEIEELGFEIEGREDMME